MPSSRGELAQFSGLLQTLYCSASEMPASEFYPAMMQLVRPLFAFESGVWQSGLGTGRVYSSYLYSKPAEFLEGYRRVGRDDGVLAEALARPGAPFRCSVDARYPAADRRKAEIRDHMLNFEVGNALIVGSAFGGSPLLNWVVFWRRERDAQYSPYDAELLQLLWPHLSQACEINQRLELDQLRSRNGSRLNALAIVDRSGAAYLAGPEFEALVRTEWSWWERPRLPVEVHEALVVRGLPRYRGKQIQFDAHRSADLLVVRVRRLDPIDRLSDREKDVALRFSEGASYKEIARALAIAPSTVRNRLQDVYRKMGVGDKAELATLIAGRKNVS